ncbi:MAG: glycosyltransferase family 39 protein, partial [Patescibacteria group bacterium]|nr:glycosyltransferase family 39 protein [Patescibacteria group bacterium]
DSHSPFMFDQKNFDTGTFPLIVIKLIYLSVTGLFPHQFTDHMGLIIIIARSLSALLSFGISVLLYIFAKKMLGEHKAFLAFVLSLCSVGFIQFAHFGTIEVWEAFFSLLLCYLCWQIQHHATLRISFLTGIIFGLSVATKILSAVLLPVIIICFALDLYHSSKKKLFLNSLENVFVFICISIAVCITVSPQILLNFPAFYASIHFESTVALGTLPVFYTQEFYNTTPFLFQLLHIYPFLLNPFLMLLLPVSVLYGLYAAVTRKNSALFIISAFFLLLFVFQSYVFVKWTRYVVPTLPFAYLLIASFFDDLLSWTRPEKWMRFTLLSIPIAVSLLYASAFVITVYATPDTRIVASQWAKDTVSPSAAILSEPYDIGFMPFTAYFPSVTIVDFYTVDQDQSVQEKLIQTLPNTDYVMLPSQRILKIRLLNPEQFPISGKFYTDLLNGSLGFTKVYETVCNSLCKLVYLGDPVFSYEETASVFDRPEVFIFKKTRLLSKGDYQQLLGVH